MEEVSNALRVAEEDEERAKQSALKRLRNGAEYLQAAKELAQAQLAVDQTKGEARINAANEKLSAKYRLTQLQSQVDSDATLIAAIARASMLRSEFGQARTAW